MLLLKSSIMSDKELSNHTFSQWKLAKKLESPFSYNFLFIKSTDLNNFIYILNYMLLQRKQECMDSFLILILHDLNIHPFKTFLETCHFSWTAVLQRVGHTQFLFHYLTDTPYHENQHLSSTFK